MAASTQVVEYDTFVNSRTGERWQDRRVLDDDFSNVRDREIPLLRTAPGSRNARCNDSNADSNSKDNLVAPPRRQVRWREGRDDYFYSNDNSNGAVVARRDDSSPSPPPPSRRSRRRDDRDRRARSSQPLLPSSSDMRKREGGNWAERNFDSSYDGLIAGAAGAAIGAIITRRFAVGDFDEKEKTNRRLKILAGSVAGAAVFNAAENWYRVYTEEKEDNWEEREEEWREGRNGVTCSSVGTCGATDILWSNLGTH